MLKEIIILFIIVILLIVFFNLDKVRINKKPLAIKNKLTFAIIIALLIIFGSILITVILTFVLLVGLVLLIYFLFSRKRSFRFSS